MCSSDLVTSPFKKRDHDVASAYEYKGFTLHLKNTGPHGFNCFSEDVEAIVNAANTGMLGGGGIDGAINSFCTRTKLAKERSYLKQNFQVQVGGAFYTQAYTFSENAKAVAALVSKGRTLLPAGQTQGSIKNIIHTVGPQGSANEENDFRLAMAFYNSLVLADRLGLKSIVFPGISIGIFGYDVDHASTAYLAGIKLFMDEHPDSELKDIRIIANNYSKLCSIIS